MKLRVNEGRLDIENMKQLVALMDAGVLVDIEKELIELVKNAPDIGEVNQRQMSVIPFGRRPNHVGRPRRVWNKANERKLIKLRGAGVKYKQIAKIFGMTSNKIGAEIFHLKKFGKWNIPRRKAHKTASKEDKRSAPKSQELKRRIGKGVRESKARRDRLNVKGEI